MGTTILLPCSNQQTIYYSFIGDGKQGTVNGEILKRVYAFSQFYRFVKSGYFTVGIELKKKLNMNVLKMLDKNLLFNMHTKNSGFLLIQI